MLKEKWRQSQPDWPGRRGMEAMGHSSTGSPGESSAGKNDDAPLFDKRSLSWLSKFVDDGHLAGLSGNEAKVMIAMLRYANYDTLEAFPLISTLVEKTGISDESGVHRAIKGGKLAGLITDDGANGRSATLRKLTLPQDGPRVKITTPVKITSGENHEGGMVKNTRGDRRKSLGHPSRKSPPISPNRSPNLNPQLNLHSLRDGLEAVETSGEGKEITPDTIYAAYPKHVEPRPSKDEAAKTVKKLEKRGKANAWAWLLDRVQLYAAARNRAAEIDPGQAQYTPALHRWLKKERYDENPTDWDVMPNGNHSNSRRNGSSNGHSQHAGRPEGLAFA